MTSTPYKDKKGTIWWRNQKGELHRDDGPAIEYVAGDKMWYLNDQRHRENGPAVEHVNGPTEWWVNGRRHRENGPAIEYANGSKYWHINGNLHRENGPAIELPDGRFEYYLHDQTSPEIEQQVKENMARIQAKKEKKELLDGLSQDNDISAKINTCFSKQPKKI